MRSPREDGRPFSLGSFFFSIKVSASVFIVGTATCFTIGNIFEPIFLAISDNFLKNPTAIVKALTAINLPHLALAVLEDQLRTDQRAYRED